jgi:Fe-S-cluster-containing dehydrogenase component
MSEPEKQPRRLEAQGVRLVKELPPVDRRSFLKGGVTGLAVLTGTVVVGSVLDAVTRPDGAPVALAKGVVLWERELCSGCRTCEAVCTNHNNRGHASSALARIILEKDYLAAIYEAHVCYQCVDPLCLRACPVAALQVDRSSGTNARVIDERACIGCRQCLAACDRVFDPPRPRYDAQRRVSTKCHLCFGEPQCVQHCPYGALRFEWAEQGLRTGYPVIEKG